MIKRTMRRKNKKIKQFFLVSMLLVSASCQERQKERVLPFIGHYDIEYKTVNGQEVEDTIYPTIPEFSYLNQDSVMISSESMKNKVWIADFFFTSCTTICPKMTVQMKRLSELTTDLSKHTQFMSFSINPTVDGPSRLRSYIKRFGIEAKNWNFFTGNEEKIHFIGDQNFLVNARPDLGSQGGYAHSEAFVLVDKEGYIRGMYNGTDSEEVDQLEQDLRKLLKHEYGIGR